MRLYLDIETIPSLSTAIHARIAETVLPPGNYKKPETIAEWEREQKPALVKEAIAKTALDGAFGHVCCIGWAWDERPAAAVWMNDVADEKGLIADFISTVAAKVANTNYGSPVIIGHNVAGFDIRFLWQRAFILGIPMPHWFPRDPKPWGNDVFDTMLVFSGQRNSIAMARLCEALGMPGKGEIDGSMIGDLWLAGKYEVISEYCRGDVERSRDIHRRMMVALGEAA